MDITEAVWEAIMRYFVWWICNCSYGWKKTPDIWMRELKYFLLLSIFSGKLYSGIFTCPTKHLLLSGRAIQMWFYTNGTHLEKNYLDFQMYLDRPSICSKNQILPVNHLFCFFSASLLSLCIQPPSVSPGHPPAPLYLSWQFQMGKLRVLNFQPSSFSDHSQILPQVWAGTRSTGQIPVLLSRTERISGRDREVDNTWECVKTRSYLSFYTLLCLLMKINKIVKN